MYLDWTTLVLLCLAGAIAWFWHDSLAAREIANSAALEACERLALQFLDGTVAFARIRIARGSTGRLVLRRTYVFDYTANSIERRQGFIVVSERRVETLGYARDEQVQEPRRPPIRSVEPGTIVELDRWRRNAGAADATASAGERSRAPENEESGN